jgi:hypothetical protein
MQWTRTLAANGIPKRGHHANDGHRDRRHDLSRADGPGVGQLGGGRIARRCWTEGTAARHRRDRCPLAAAHRGTTGARRSVRGHRRDGEEESGETAEARHAFWKSKTDATRNMPHTAELEVV